jgi:imidazolonepropionase-like amidohydrolase
MYGPTDAFLYKVKLKHETWKNIEKLLRPTPKFSMMSDHPVTLQRNLFYSLRQLLRFGLSKAEAIYKKNYTGTNRDWDSKTRSY